MQDRPWGSVNQYSVSSRLISPSRMPSSQLSVTRWSSGPSSGLYTCSTTYMHSTWLALMSKLPSALQRTWACSLLLTCPGDGKQVLVYFLTPQYFIQEAYDPLLQGRGLLSAVQRAWYCSPRFTTPS